jgi:hypothetical protein
VAVVTLPLLELVVEEFVVILEGFRSEILKAALPQLASKVKLGFPRRSLVVMVVVRDDSKGSHEGAAQKSLLLVFVGCV